MSTGWRKRGGGALEQESKSELNAEYCRGHDDGFEAGRLQGIKQERALWELARIGQEIEAEAAKQEPVAEPHKGEPVAKYIGEDWAGSLVSLYEDIPLNTLLYTTPYVPEGRQQCKPLTDEQILELNFDGEFCILCDDDEAILNFARAIEAAHGIRPSDFKE